MSKNKTESIVFINGSFLPSKKARISPFDHGLLYGIGVWDTANAFGGYIFKLDEHITRFYKSAKVLNLPIAFSKAETKDIIVETVRRNKYKNAYIKFILTKGIGEPKITAQCEEPTFVVITSRADPLPSPNGLRGKKAVIVSTRSIPPMCGVEPRIKQLNYLNRYLMISEAIAAGADQAIALDINGYVTECATQNIFMVSDSIICTPLTSQMLDGVTQKVIIEIAQREGYKVIKQLLTPYDLCIADEVFSTSTGIGVTPLIAINNRNIGEGKPGPVTLRIYTKFWEMVRKGEYGTPIY